MDQSKLLATQLQRRDPAAWTAILRRYLGVEDVVVTAVSAQPVRRTSFRSRVTRYLLAFDDCTDPITLIGKRTTLKEVCFYQNLSDRLPGVAPRCYFQHEAEDGKRGWVALDDVPDQIPPQKWAAADLEILTGTLADLHAGFWGREEVLQAEGAPWLIGGRQYTWAELKAEHPVYFVEGPGAILSEHAIERSGNLAPVLLKAANGLAVMRALNGWPGILGETHLTIAADLLDDPVPMLEPLRRLPPTLLHGAAHPYHWRATLFDDMRLLDWQQICIGPGVFDLVNFLEQFPVLYEDDGRAQMILRTEWPISEETIIDNYILALSQRLGSDFDGRALRQALPAARCLQILSNWFVFFANWFDDMPDLYTWQRVNRMSEAELQGTRFAPMAQYRPYLTAVFQRFLKAYRSL